MKVAYFPGCSLHSTGIEFDISVREVCKAVGIELEEIEGWICCGATSAHATNHLLSLAMPAYSLALAERMDVEDVVAPCAACFNRLKHTAVLCQDKATFEKVRELLPIPWENRLRIRNLLDLFVGMLEEIKPKITKPLSDLKLASYYGCLLLRPPHICQFDDPENPTTMDELLRACGAQVVDWTHKTECCGANLTIPRSDLVVELTYRILKSAKTAGADAIVTACPFCHLNLDARQADVHRVKGEIFNIPILYFTQVLGLALGIPAKKLGLRRHLVDPFLIPTLRRR
ncbi:CoB--CoM heterodisulfide reductase iron-sulfur subunit B family protein [bacterium]|nr:CoB--CoM heterodisulfide reductase iron-sulfur subunit B family protein [bacterium]